MNAALPSCIFPQFTEIREAGCARFPAVKGRELSASVQNFGFWPPSCKIPGSFDRLCGEADFCPSFKALNRKQFRTTQPALLFPTALPRIVFVDGGGSLG